MTAGSTWSRSCLTLSCLSLITSCCLYTASWISWLITWSQNRNGMRKKYIKIHPGTQQGADSTTLLKIYSHCCVNSCSIVATSLFTEYILHLPVYLFLLCFLLVFNHLLQLVVSSSVLGLQLLALDSQVPAKLLHLDEERHRHHLCNKHAEDFHVQVTLRLGEDSAKKHGGNFNTERICKSTSLPLVHIDTNRVFWGDFTAYINTKWSINVETLHSTHNCECMHDLDILC